MVQGPIPSELKKGIQGKTTIELGEGIQYKPPSNSDFLTVVNPMNSKKPIIAIKELKK